MVAGTYAAAYASAQCALTAADVILKGERDWTFALCRPPGHHAGRDFMGGYCYLNNACIAAKFLSGHQRHRVAIIDVDYHAGNGSQDIFYDSPNILTISLHADPELEYPFHIGFQDESGAGAGEGLHLNIPLAPGTDDQGYLKALAPAICK